jgi:hypothetical protein
MDNNELQHHGVKGMRWGVTRSKKELARARGGKSAATQPAKASTKPASTKSDENDVEPPSTKALKDRNERLKLEKEYKTLLMNDDDLKERVNRLKLEQEYNQLTAKEKSKGRQILEDVISNSVKTVATTFVTGALTKLVNNALNKAGEDKPAAETTAQKKKTTAEPDANKTDAASKAKKTAEAFSNARKASATYTSRAGSSKEKTSFGFDDFDISGGSSGGSRKAKDRVIYDADFVDISSNAGRSFFDTVFALPPAPSALALPAPKDD